MGIIHTGNLYTTINVIDKTTGATVYSTSIEGYGTVTGSFGNPDITNVCKQLELQYPKPRFEIEIFTMKD